MKLTDIFIINKLDSTKRFSSRVTNYQKYRPNYPPDAIDYIYKTLNLQQKNIADIGSGTGIMTEHFLKRENIVYAVEPNNEMRSEAEKILTHYPNFKSVAGTAEATQLPEHSIDCVICAQSFHWFIVEKSRKEFLRILKDQGNVVLVWNKRESASPFGKEYEKLLNTFTDDYKKIGHKKTDEKVFDRFFKVYTKATFKNQQSFDLTGFKGRVFSSSYTPQTGDKNYEAFLASLEKLFEEFQADRTISFAYQTNVIIGKL